MMMAQKEEEEEESFPSVFRRLFWLNNMRLGANSADLFYYSKKKKKICHKCLFFWDISYTKESKQKVGSIAGAILIHFHLAQSISTMGAHHQRSPG